MLNLGHKLVVAHKLGLGFICTKNKRHEIAALIFGSILVVSRRSDQNLVVGQVGKFFTENYLVLSNILPSQVQEVKGLDQ